MTKRLPHSPLDPPLRRRYRGCLLGGAVGDALGAPVEFSSRTDIQQRFGRAGITELAPAFGRLGAITDDTQMTLFTAEGVLRAYVRGTLRGICSPPTVIDYAYLRWLHTQGVAHPLHGDCLNGWLIGQRELFSRRAPGLTCLSSLSYKKRAGDQATNDSKGCGGVMRVAPIGLFFATLARSRPQLEADYARQCFELASKAAALTHGHRTAQCVAGAFAVMVMSLMGGTALPGAIAVAMSLTRTEAGHEETVAAIEGAVRLARERPADTETLSQLGSGWVADEALAITLYCALSGKDFRSGVELAVNHGGDSDSTGSMTGQLLGAVHGVEAIPPTWLEPLELREVITALADDLVTFSEWRLDDDAAPDEEEFYFNRYPGA